MRTQLEIERRLKIPRGFEPLGSTVDIERESISRASEHFGVLFVSHFATGKGNCRGRDFPITREGQKGTAKAGDVQQGGL